MQRTPQSTPIETPNMLTKTGPFLIIFDKSRGPLRKGTPSLIDEATKQEYFISRNTLFTGCSVARLPGASRPIPED